MMILKEQKKPSLPSFPLLTKQKEICFFPPPPPPAKNLPSREWRGTKRKMGICGTEAGQHEGRGPDFVIWAEYPGSYVSKCCVGSKSSQQRRAAVTARV